MNLNNGKLESQLRTDLILQLADYLETVPADNLYMHSWCKGMLTVEEIESCGTVFCAFGWAIQAKIAQTTWQEFMGSKKPTHMIARTFDCKFNDAFHMFMAQTYRTRDQVIADLREWAETGNTQFMIGTEYADSMATTRRGVLDYEVY